MATSGFRDVLVPPIGDDLNHAGNIVTADRYAKLATLPRATSPKEVADMNITLSLGPLISLIAGILILIIPRLLNYIVAIYLIVIGLIGIFGVHNWRL
jgi:hypothetical protein